MNRESGRPPNTSILIYNLFYEVSPTYCNCLYKFNSVARTSKVLIDSNEAILEKRRQIIICAREEFFFTSIRHPQATLERLRNHHISGTIILHFHSFVSLQGRFAAAKKNREDSMSVTLKVEETDVKVTLELDYLRFEGIRLS